jgi:glycine/D-amino acid oxidase-like deaminating enzyme
MPGYGARYWAERTPESRRKSYPTYRGEQTADVVVIGGGLTGATSAYVLAAAGLDVVVLEAARIAAGGTSAGLGVVLPEPDASLRTVEPAAGRRVARLAWTEARRSALDLAALIRRTRVRADLADTVLAINAATPEQGTALRKEQAARKEAGVDAPWLPAAAARQQLGTDSVGAIRVRDAFLIDPVRAAAGLVAAAQAKGARVFERSEVRRTKFTRKHADVILQTGTIRAGLVVVATGEPGGLFASLRRHVRRQWGYAVLTAPLPAAMRREVGRRNTVMTEATAARYWLRWLADDRALFAGGLTDPPSTRQRDALVRPRTADLMYELSKRYPAISGLPAAAGWDSAVVSTADGLPWIGPHRNYPFHFFAFAFGMHGEGLAMFAAKAALRFFRGEPRREDTAFSFVR